MALTGCCVVLAAAQITTAAAASSPPDRSAEVVEGSQRSRVLVPPGIDVGDYENEGYALRQIARRPDGSLEVEVQVSAAPRSGGRAAVDPPPIRAESPAIERLVDALAARLHEPDARARRLAAWVARNIEYRLDRSRSQRPVEVLERRDAYCTGSARLLVALLEAAGLEAREVPGFAVNGTANSAPGFHRWVEYRPPDGNWRFVDPLSSFGYVPATFVRLGGEELPEAAASATWRLLDFEDQLSPLTHDLELPAGMRSVGTERTRTRGARIRVIAPENTEVGDAFRVVLRGPWIRERVLRQGQAVVFTDVSAGAYEVVLEKADSGSEGAGEGLQVFEQSLTVAATDAADGRTLDLTWAPAGSVTRARSGPETPR